MKNFYNKVVLITGASRGLGGALAKSFAKEGAELVLIAKRMDGLESIATELDEYGISPTLVPVDLSKPENIMALPNAIQEKHGRLDVIIGNAAMMNALMPLTHFSPRDMEKIFNVNVLSNWHLLAGLERLMKKSNNPRAIFVTSGASHLAMPFWGPYAATKAALEEMVKTYAQEQQNTNYRINLVDPGVMTTDMFKRAMPGADLSKVANPENRIGVFHYLASDTCHETGQIFKAS